MERLRPAGVLGEEERASSTSGARRSAAIPKAIERTVHIQPADVDDLEAYLEAGAEHLIVGLGHPFDLEPVRRLLDARG